MNPLETSLVSYCLQNNLLCLFVLASASAPSGPFSTGDAQSCCSSLSDPLPAQPGVGAVGARHVLEVLTPIMGYRRRKERAFYSRGFQRITTESLEVMDVHLGACKKP